LTAPSDFRKERLVYLALAVLIMAAGLVWRLAPLGLPVFWLRHGGGALWGAMVFCFVAALRPGRFGRGACLAIGSAIAVAAEVFRLYHAPALDAFRGTLAGALLLGRVFSVANIFAYEVGIVIAAIALWRPPTRLRDADRRSTQIL
jgi:hypothetical protein